MTRIIETDTQTRLDLSTTLSPFRDQSAFASHRRVPKLGSDSSNPQYQDEWLDLSLAGLTGEAFHFRHGQVSEILYLANKTHYALAYSTYYIQL